MKVNLGTLEVTDAEATALRQRLTGSTGKATASRGMVREWALGLLRRHLGGEAPAEPAPVVVTRRPDAEPFQPGGAAVLQRAVRGAWNLYQDGASREAIVAPLRPVLGWCGVVLGGEEPPAEPPAPATGTEPEGGAFRLDGGS